MMIVYECPKCKSKRVLSSIQEKVLCKKCESEMFLKKDNIHSDSLTTEESRFMADEAMYNTLGDRTTGLFRSH